jgi:hypothetical protein
MANPLIDIKNIVVAGIRDFGAVAALSAKFKAFDRAMDVRGDFDGQADLGKRIQVPSVRSSLDLVWSSDTAQFKRRFEIAIGTGNLSEDDLLDMEWAVMMATRNLYELLNPQGLAPLVVPAPLSIESILITDCDPQREPAGDPEEWYQVCDATVTAKYPRASFFPNIP